ncbi:MAG: uroporphyrinogen decarboxylase [Thermoanaerobaculia bacterium]
MNDRFLRACRREPVDRTPVWFMRQAGRYMPAYRALRAKHTLLEICRTPELATEVTLQPLERFDLDAAIIFADLLLPFEPMGADFEFAKGEGPVVHRPVRDRAAVEGLRAVDPETDLGYVLDAIRMVRRALDGRVPLIGFAGAPFTLASYLIEGGASRHYIHTKRMMQEEPGIWHLLMEKLAATSAAFLRAQVEAGAQAVQLFDSWVGCLGPLEYRQYVLPHSKAVFDALADLDVPRIHFGTGTSSFLELLRIAGGDVIGIDWRIEIDVAWRAIGYDTAVQGNLDPVALFGPRPLLESRIAEILHRASGRPGHIFNLGHGILPETPEENVEAAVEYVHSWKS